MSTIRPVKLGSTVTSSIGREMAGVGVHEPIDDRAHRRSEIQKQRTQGVT